MKYYCEWCGTELTDIVGIADVEEGTKQAVGYCPKHGKRMWGNPVDPKQEGE